MPQHTCDQSLGIHYMVESFYNRFYLQHEKDVYIERHDANHQLRGFLAKQLNCDDNTLLEKRIKKRVNLYYSHLNETASKAVLVGDPGKNVNSIFYSRPSVQGVGEDEILTVIYKKTRTPSRETLVKLAFALDFTLENCQNMLLSAGHRPLRTDGNDFEKTIAWCLKQRKSYLDAVHIYSQHQSPNTKTFEAAKYCDDILQHLCIITPNLSVLDFHNFFWERSKDVFRRVQTEPKLHFTRLDKFFLELQQKKICPTREIFCLLLTYHFYAVYPTSGGEHSLQSYLNAALTRFGLPVLDNSRIFDALLCELSMYDVQSAQKNMIMYGQQTRIVLNLENAKAPIEIIYKILYQYTLSEHKYMNPLTKIKLQDKNYYAIRLTDS